MAVVPNGTAPALKQPYLPGQYTEYPAAVQGLAQQALPGGGSGIEGGLDTSIKNIDEFIGGNKSFDDVLDDYAKVYADKINSNQAWSWDDTIPGGENLTKKQRSIIKQQAIDAGLITDIKVTKVEGMRSAGFYWSIGKPRTANDDRYDLNKKCDENASVEVITRIINGGKSKLEEREKAYAYFSEVIQ